MWYTLRAGLLAGLGAFPGCFGRLPGAPSSYMLVLYYAIRVYVNSFAAYYSHKIYIIILLPHCALCALWYTLTARRAGGSPGRSLAVLDGAGGYAAGAGAGVNREWRTQNKRRVLKIPPKIKKPVLENLPKNKRRILTYALLTHRLACATLSLQDEGRERCT